MTLQITVGSTPEELANLEQLLQLLTWNREVLTTTYGDGPYDPTVPLTADQLQNLHAYFSVMYSLLTDVNVFDGHPAAI